MWLFYSYSNGYIPMGNDGQMKVPASVRSRRKLVELANNFRAGRPGRVYLMHDWTQAMCELGPRAFEEYIQRHGEVLSHS